MQTRINDGIFTAKEHFDKNAERTMTTQTAPQGKYNELVGRINSIKGSESIDELARKRLAVEAEKLAKAAPEYGWAVKGMLAALQRRYKESKRCHEMAIKINPGNAVLYDAFATSMQHLGYYLEAIDKINEVCGENATDPAMLDKLIQYTATAGMPVKAHALLRRWNSLKPTEKHEAQDLIEEMTAFYAKYGIEEKQAVMVFDIAFSVMRKNNVRHRLLSIAVYKDECDEWLSLECEVYGSQEEVNDLHHQLIDEMVLRDMRDKLTDLLLRFSLGFRRAQ